MPSAACRRAGKHPRRDGRLPCGREAIMKLMPIKQAQAKLFNAASDKRLQEIALRTFKKDRSVALQHEGDGWVLIEEGFEARRTALPHGPEGKRLVKEAFKREFPRSTRAYVEEVRRAG